MKTQETLYKEHAENKDYNSRLAFYKDEIAIFEKQLEEIAKEEQRQRHLVKIEKFQNQFEIQKKNIDDLSHKVRADEKIIDKGFESSASKQEIAHHPEEKNSIASFEKTYKELKEDFQKFMKEVK